MVDFQELRRRMVMRDIVGRGIRTASVLEAIGRVPREDFVPDELRKAAYDDMPLPIGDGQTISQPYIVALMIEAAHLGPDDTVLDIGTGSGYAAAVLAEIAHRVISVERIAGLAAAATKRLATAGYHNVTVIVGDGTAGAAQHAPFDAILAAAAGVEVPKAWVQQLVPGGRIVLPLSYPGGEQELIRITSHGDGETTRQSLGAVRFVPLV
ncbi:MAG: protein-L-isoaspartate(D-aspartate) O-methyltransferase [Microbacteriaceae bacterium]